MREKEFNLDLCKRFVSDNNLPIPILHDKEKFDYYLDLYENLYHSRSLWESLCNEIDTKYRGDINEFLNTYYIIRDKMITDILENEKYQEFLKVDMSKFNVSEDLKKFPKGNVYNLENIGKCFLSIDLKKGNFQAIKYFDKSIVKNKDTYEEYVGHYIDSKYLQGSKYTRQVVFGKCNPSRQISIEKHLMSMFYESFDDKIGALRLERFNTDEIVFEVIGYHNLSHDCKSMLHNYIEDIVVNAAKNSGVDVSYNIYTLRAACLYSERNNKERNPFYVLENELKYEQKKYEVKFKEVPLVYHALCYKLWFGEKLVPTDYYFRYEGLDTYIDDKFILKILG
jgi:hypothetical protein